MPEQSPTTHAQDDINSAPPKPTLHAFFFGDDGLRAGWAILLYLLLAALFGFALFALAIHTHILHVPTQRKFGEAAQQLLPRTQGLGELLQLAAILIAAGLMTFAESLGIPHRPFARYGLALSPTPAGRALPDFAIGLLWGITMLSVLIAALLATHAIVFGGLLLHGAPAITFAGKWLLVFLLVGLTEEFLFRGYLQYTLARGIAGLARALSAGSQSPAFGHPHALSFSLAACLLSVCLFMLAHAGNPGETLPGILAVGLAGAVFALSLWRTGSLWWAVGFHTTWDWGQSYLFGTPDSGTLVHGHLLASRPVGAAWLSGGADGPEGSLLVIPTLLLTALIIHLTLPYRPRPLTPDQQPPGPLP